MRLKSISLSGFRGFSTTAEFDLSADATVIVGSNGMGKTSLLDGIHWGLCGHLPRIGGSDDNVVSVYSETGQATVTVNLENENGTFRITRTTCEGTQSVELCTNGGTYTGTSAKSRIFEALCPESATAEDGNDNFSESLANSIYLQQDKIRDFLESASSEHRFNVVSELIGAGKLTELQAQLESESRSWSRATSTRKSELDPIEARFRNLKQILDSLRESANVGETLDEHRWTEWWQDALEISDSNSEVPSPTASNASSLLDGKIRELIAIQDSVSRRISSINVAKRLLSEKPEFSEERYEVAQQALSAARERAKAADEELQKGQEKVAEIRKQQIAARDLQERRMALSEIALGLLEGNCPVCDQEHETKKTRERLEGIISQGVNTEYVPSSNIDINALAEQQRSARLNVEKNEAQLSEESSKARAVQDWEQRIEQALKAIDIDQADDAIAALGHALSSSETTASKLNALVSQGDHLSLSVAKTSALARMKSVEQEIDSVHKSLTDQKNHIEKRDQAASKIKVIIAALRDARSTVALDKLQEIEPLFNRIYSRIDPHPTFRDTRLSTAFFNGKGRLDAQIVDPVIADSKFSPEVILSSSQLNALAVSIFLSFNLAFSKIGIKSVVLDDPIQSLDPINLLGLVDLLRRIKDQKQLLVSTHDEKFGRLLTKKLRPPGDQHTTSAIIFNSWGREGPKWEQIEVKDSIVPFRLASMG